MLLLVHTVTMTLADIEMCARFYHALCPVPQRTAIALIGKRIAVTFNKKKGLCRSFKHRSHPPQLRHNLQAISLNGFRSTVSVPPKEEISSALVSVGQSQTVIADHSIPDSANNPMQLPVLDSSLPCNATAQQTSAWLQSHRFSMHLRTFSSFSGADLLRLSRDDLIQICGLADGIRLFNALNTKAKTLYLCLQSSPIVYHAVYLASVSNHEVTAKLAKLLGIAASKIQDVYMQGPSGIHVLISDELVHNIKDEAMFTVEILQDRPSDRLNILLKPPSL